MYDTWSFLVKSISLLFTLSVIVIGITPGTGAEVTINRTSTSIDACTSLVNVYTNDLLWNHHTLYMYYKKSVLFILNSFTKKEKLNQLHYQMEKSNNVKYLNYAQLNVS